MRLTIEQFTSNPAHSYASLIKRHRQLQIQHTHDFYELFFVVSGHANHHINGQVQQMHKGIVVFIRPADSHAFLQMSADFAIINIIISEEITLSLFAYLGEMCFEKQFSNSILPPTSKLSDTEFAYIMNELDQLVLSKRILKEQSEVYFKIALMKIFTTCYPICPPHSNVKIPDWLQWLLLEMMKNQHFIEGLPALEKLTNKSYEHFARSCRKYLDKTPTELINEMRLNYSVSMITSSTRSITEIALDSGFESLSHYYHLFKKQYGMTPKDLRSRFKDQKVSIYDEKFSLNYVRDEIPEGIDFGPLLNR